MDSVSTPLARYPEVTAIVLCGGFGTRLRVVAQDIPKPMVPVNQRPFLEYVLDQLIEQGIGEAILAVSYLREVIQDHFGNQYKSLKINYSEEEFPLGTGGAIKQAIGKQFNHYYLVLNGDSYVDYNLPALLADAANQDCQLVMMVKHMDDTGRYGRVELGRNGRIESFAEKTVSLPGYINAGVYLVHQHIATLFPQKDTFSFEHDILSQQLPALNPQANEFPGYFIDIGIEEDYYRACREWGMGSKETR